MRPSGTSDIEAMNLNLLQIKYCFSTGLSAWVLVLLIGGVLTGCAHHHEPVHPPGHGTEIGQLVFDETTRSIIYDYYRNLPRHSRPGGKRIPPGLSKRGGSLPPGLAKRSVLPPGLQKRSLPPSLISRLPAVHPDAVRVIVDDSILLLHRTTHVVLDIIEHVARH